MPNLKSAPINGELILYRLNELDKKFDEKARSDDVRFKNLEDQINNISSPDKKTDWPKLFLATLTIFTIIFTIISQMLNK